MSEYDEFFFLAKIENTFDCHFPADTDESRLTLGDVHDFVVASLGTPVIRGSVNMHVFNAVRRALIHAGLKRSDLKPDARLDALIPKPMRRNVWSQFLQDLPWSTTHMHLRFPRIMAQPFAIAAGCAFFGIWIVAFAMLALHIFTLIHFIAVIWILVGATYFLSTESKNGLATEIPEAFGSPRKITHILVLDNYGKIAKQTHVWDETEVWHLIEEMVMDRFPTVQQPIAREQIVSSMYGDSD